MGISPNPVSSRSPVFIDCPAPEDTRALGARLAGGLGEGAVVLLDGTLGAGKTEFVRGMASGLGFTGRVASPTFVRYRRYEGRRVLHHLDAYRFADPAELWALGADEFLGREGITVVEWGGRVRGLVRGEPVVVAIEFTESGRRIAVSGGGENFS